MIQAIIEKFLQWLFSNKNKKVTIPIIIALSLGLLAVGYYQVFIDKNDPGKTIAQECIEHFQGTKASASSCANITLPDYKHTGVPIYKIRYTIPIPDSAEVNKANFETVRLERISNTLRDADAQLQRNNKQPYGAKLLRYFKEVDAAGKKIIDILTDQHLIYFNESIDTITCRYKHDIRLAYAKGKDINDLVDYASDLMCIKNAIDNLVINRLLTESEVNTSFPEIFAYLCNHCANTQTVARMVSECDDINNCRQLFFEKGCYQLTLLSTLILDALSSQLHKSPDVNYTLIFSGFTDPSAVGNIQYNGNAYVADLGRLLPDNKAPATKIGNNITDNVPLSFARGASCYEYIGRKAGMGNLRIFYTGYGVNNNGLDDAHKRSVEIKIIKEN